MELRSGGGSTMVKVAPAPGPALAAMICPPCSTTMARAMASATPKESALAEVYACSTCRAASASTCVDARYRWSRKIDGPIATPTRPRAT
jgi:hypothetical protein